MCFPVIKMPEVTTKGSYQQLVKGKWVGIINIIHSTSANKCHAANTPNNTTMPWHLICEFFLSPAGDGGLVVPWSVEGVSIGRSLLHMSLSLQHFKAEVCVSNRPSQTPILSSFACSIVSMQPRVCSKVFVVSENLISRKQE